MSVSDNTRRRRKPYYRQGTLFNNNPEIILVGNNKRGVDPMSPAGRGQVSRLRVVVRVLHGEDAPSLGRRAQGRGIAEHHG